MLNDDKRGQSRESALVGKSRHRKARRYRLSLYIDGVKTRIEGRSASRRDALLKQPNLCVGKPAPLHAAHEWVLEKFEN
jgi:hypothetical protein